MYDKIIIAVDGSAHSERALQEGAKIAQMSQACHIELVTVIDFAKAKKDVLHSGSKEELELKRKEKFEHMEKFLMEKNVHHSLMVLHGDPGPAIVEYANGQKPDLVIVGSKGKNQIQEMVLGSVSHKIAKRVNAPVLIVK